MPPLLIRPYTQADIRDHCTYEGSLRLVARLRERWPTARFRVEAVAASDRGNALWAIRSDMVAGLPPGAGT